MKIYLPCLTHYVVVCLALALLVIVGSNYIYIFWIFFAGFIQNHLHVNFVKLFQLTFGFTFSYRCLGLPFICEDKMTWITNLVSMDGKRPNKRFKSDNKGADRNARRRELYKLNMATEKAAVSAQQQQLRDEMLKNYPTQITTPTICTGTIKTSGYSTSALTLPNSCSASNTTASSIPCFYQGKSSFHL